VLGLAVFGAVIVVVLESRAAVADIARAHGLLPEQGDLLCDVRATAKVRHVLHVDALRDDQFHDRLAQHLPSRLDGYGTEAGDLATELPAGTSGEIGYLTRAFGTLVARLREKENQGELEKLSLTDPLTGLYNRRHLMGTLATEVQRSRRQRRPFTVLLADVDKFKQYNDTHGHLAGDAALVKVAEVFRRTTRAVDCVARYGGEEFVVMLLECPIATAALVAERIRARVAEQDLGEGKVTVSIGLAEYPDGGDTPEELIATADAAMYQAKSSGRNQVVVAGVMHERAPEKKARRKREQSA